MYCKISICSRSYIMHNSWVIESGISLNSLFVIQRCNSKIISWHVSTQWLIVEPGPSGSNLVNWLTLNKKLCQRTPISLSHFPLHKRSLIALSYILPISFQKDTHPSYGDKGYSRSAHPYTLGPSQLSPFFEGG